MSYFTPALIEEATQHLKTVQDWLRFGASQFEKAELTYGHGQDDPWMEAGVLLLDVLHLTPDYLPDILKTKLLPTERAALIELYEKRIFERIPAAYLIKKAWFAGMDFYVDERVLVPRSPLAEWIERSFEPFLEPGQVLRILDLCTGSACIACACAQYFPDAQVDAVDISVDALTVAKKNVERHGLGDRVRLIQSDLFAALTEKNCYDLIISNPPYVADTVVAGLPKEYQHEPSLGLAAGQEGLDFALPILDHAAEYLTPEGVLVVEVGYSNAALEEARPDLPFLWLDFERGGEGVFLLTADQLS